METTPGADPGAGAAQDATHSLHLVVSNQSLALTTAELAVEIDGQSVFRRVLTTGTQHTWVQVTVPVAGGSRQVSADEAGSRATQSLEVTVDRELWIAITFHGPPARIDMRVFDQPVAVM